VIQESHADEGLTSMRVAPLQPLLRELSGDRLRLGPLTATRWSSALRHVRRLPAPSRGVRELLADALHIGSDSIPVEIAFHRLPSGLAQSLPELAVS
jgi:hypothetical protein